MDHRTLLSSSFAAANAFTLLDDANSTSVNEFIESLKEYGKITDLIVSEYNTPGLNGKPIMVYFAEKEPWVVENLITHYLRSESQRAADLIAATHSMHDKVSYRADQFRHGMYACFSSAY